jgi:hypothetical protein
MRGDYSLFRIFLSGLESRAGEGRSRERRRLAILPDGFTRPDFDTWHRHGDATSGSR